MSGEPKRLTPEEAVKFIDLQNSPILSESRARFASGTWVITIHPGGHFTFASPEQAAKVKR